jgi:hypothetical protein
MTSRNSIWYVGANLMLVALLLQGGCSRDSEPSVSTVNKKTVEQAHGLKLPESARNCQQRCIGYLFDHGILSLVEIDDRELPEVLAQLNIRSRNPPAKQGFGNPCVNGWNVWPANSTTFVPGNRGLGGMKHTWAGPATPVEMLSCSSAKGDWLHVEIWSVAGHKLLKLYTDWN